MEADRARTPLAARASRILVQSCPAGPAVEAVVDGRGWPILGWAVFPATPRFLHVQDGAITRRSSTLRAPGWFFGRCGSIAAQASSLNQNSLLILASAASRRQGI